MSDSNELPGPGHNKPPTLTDELADRGKALIAELEALAARATAAPREIADPAGLEVATKLVLDGRDLWDKIEKTRVAEKAPYLKAEREVDAWFKSPLDRAARIVDVFLRAASAWQKKVDEAKRREAAEAARKAREEEERRLEAQRKAEEDNRRKHADQHAAKVDEARQAAEAAEAVAAAPAAELTRTTTTFGATVSSREEWTFEIVRADEIPLDKLRPYFKVEDIEKAIRLAVKQGVRDIAGVRIFKETKANIRR